MFTGNIWWNGDLNQEGLATPMLMLLITMTCCLPVLISVFTQNLTQHLT